MTEGPRLLGALRDLVAALDEVNEPHMIIGGLAVIASGVPRTTGDVDATVWGETLDIERCAGTLGRFWLEPRIEDMAEFASRHRVMLLVHSRTSIPVDLTLAGLPLEREALEAAVEVDFGGLTIRIPRPEDLVIYKLVARRPVDLDDAERLLAIHASIVDLDRVRRWVAEFAATLGEPDRPEELESIIRRARALAAR